jgi:NAD(P)-dependent dehydrogenase (short-subunit alcohol dehydrogenase family)
METRTRTAVVTGGNRGIGLEVARQLGQRGLRVILTARDLAKGEAAAAVLRSEDLAVTAVSLDVADGDSIRTLAAELGPVDVLVNNAGVLLDMADAGDSLFDAKLETFEQTFRVNVWGPLQLSQALVPAMKARGWGRVVNVSSGMGQLHDMGSGSPAYRLSKTALNALTRILADELHDSGVLVNAVCPGWVRTDMGGSSAPRTPEQGADTIAWLATLPDDGPTGGFFRDRRPIPW